MCFQGQRRLLLNLGCADSQRSSPGDLVSFYQLQIILVICHMDTSYFQCFYHIIVLLDFPHIFSLVLISLKKEWKKTLWKWNAIQSTMGGCELHGPDQNGSRSKWKNCTPGAAWKRERGGGGRSAWSWSKVLLLLPSEWLHPRFSSYFMLHPDCPTKMPHILKSKCHSVRLQTPIFPTPQKSYATIFFGVHRTSFWSN